METCENKFSIKNKRFKFILQLTAVFFVIASTLLIILDLPNININTPLGYHCDSTFTIMACNTAVTQGWYWKNDRLGMPVGQRMYDFPNFDPTSLLIMKLFGLCFKNIGLIYNFYIISTFFLAAFAAFGVLRCEKFSFYTSLLISILFSFSYFKLGYSYIFLGNIYVIPLVVWLVLNVVRGEKVPVNKKLRRLIYITISILAGFSSGYYVFFSCFFLLIAGLCNAIHNRRLSRLFKPAIFVTIILFCFVLNLLPSILFKYKNENNPIVGKRQPFETEVYALSITKLLMPEPYNKTNFLSDYRNFYNETSFLPLNESKFSSLGMVGAIGFLILMGSVFLKRGEKPKYDTLYYLSLFVMFGFLWATAGGFNTIFAYLINSQLRCPCRIGGFMSFFSLMAFGICLDFLMNKIRLKYNVCLYHFIVIFCCLFIVYISLPNNRFANKDYTVLSQEEKKFVAEIEQIVPRNSMIYQLPFIPFPESPSVNKITDYEQAKFSFYSDSLRWSYGAMRSRDDILHQDLSKLPLEEFLANIIVFKFRGIVVYRLAYEDNGEKIIGDLSGITGQKPLESSRKRYVFFDLQDKELQTRLLSKFTEETSFSWKDGVYSQESDSEHKWRWSKKKSSFFIVNYTNKPLRIDVAFDLITSHKSKKSTFRMFLNNSEHNKLITSGFIEVMEPLVIPTGLSEIRFDFNGKRYPAPEDPRELYFCIRDFSINIKNN